MQMETNLSVTMLAACGMNCAVCYAHLRAKKPCQGCRGEEPGKPEHCRNCQIKECAAGQGSDFCFACSTFPCVTIKRLDKSYRKRYQVSLIENAIRIKTAGANEHLREERERWTCKQCGGVIALHDRLCSECGKGLDGDS